MKCRISVFIVIDKLLVWVQSSLCINISLAMMAILLIATLHWRLCPALGIRTFHLLLWVWDLYHRSLCFMIKTRLRLVQFRIIKAMCKSSPRAIDDLELLLRLWSLILHRSWLRHSWFVLNACDLVQVGNNPCGLVLEDLLLVCILLSRNAVKFCELLPKLVSLCTVLLLLLHSIVLWLCQQAADPTRSFSFTTRALQLWHPLQRCSVRSDEICVRLLLYFGLLWACWRLESCCEYGVVLVKVPYKNHHPLLICIFVPDMRQ